jgi:hypothetical protein
MVRGLAGKYADFQLGLAHTQWQSLLLKSQLVG